MAGLEQVIDLITSLVRGGKTPLDAYKQICSFFPDAELVKQALNQFEERTGRIRTLKEPISLEARGLQNWYPGPDLNQDTFWPALRQHLLERGRPEKVVGSIDQASTKVVAMLQPPGLGRFTTRGLVIGYVQSGKTANFSAVIAKAADVGYKLFIVLSGITNPLRSQTQLRLNRELVDLNPQQWVTLTNRDEDFRASVARNASAFLTDHHAQKILCVIKKNAPILRRLDRWLQSAQQEVLSNCPVLIIDDEADQASVNASGHEDRRTVINKLLLQILGRLPKAAYVGYTATPFANVLIDPSVPEDLYPRDFIMNLPRPEDYFGPEKIFGRAPLTHDEPEDRYDGLNMIRFVPEEEIGNLKPKGKNDWQMFEPEITQTLATALRYFWLATAARHTRGAAGDHSTMLIHTTLYSLVHERFRQPVEAYRDKILKRLRQQEPTLLQELEALWREEQAQVPSSLLGESTTTFATLLPHLISVLERTDVVIENSQSEARLVFPEDGSIQIVIGGNTLARGLTLEGLLVSFFVRAATAYDTLLQMGRWFGYRMGYADLPRIWMTEELERWFKDLATVEEEIRQDIKRYEREGLTPQDFAVRIRTHPKLAITSQLKMQAAMTCQISYAGSRVQTILFKHKDRAWLLQNQQAARSLLTEAAQRSAPQNRGGTVTYHRIPTEHILEFLRSYRFHENSIELQAKLLTGYIREQQARGRLRFWNVGVVGRQTPDQAGVIELLPDLPVGLLTRSRIETRTGSADTANLGVIMSDIDIVADLPVPVKREKGMETADLLAMRDGMEEGLLLLYPIARDSRPRVENPATDRRRRVPLEAVEHIIGLGLVFPQTSDLTPQKYVTVDLSRIEREEIPWIDEDEEAQE